MEYPQEMYLPLMDRTVTVHNSEERLLCEQVEKLQAVLRRRGHDLNAEGSAANLGLKTINGVTSAKRLTPFERRIR